MIMFIVLDLSQNNRTKGGCKMIVKFGKQKVWEKIQRECSGNDIGESVLSYAKRLADKMEQDFMGIFNHEAAARAREKVDVEERLKNQLFFSIAVQLLAEVWIYGEELRQWHNIVVSDGNLSYAIRKNMDGGIILI